MRLCCQIAGSSSWHARHTVLTYLQIMVFYNLFTFMSDQRAVDDVRALVIKLLEDEQLEVKKEKPTTVPGGERLAGARFSAAVVIQHSYSRRSPPAPLAVAMETPGCCCYGDSIPNEGGGRG